MTKRYRWLISYLRQRARRARGSASPIHVMFCVADHFEPDWGGAVLREQVARVDRWTAGYPAVARGHRDADGVAPKWTFFYPVEMYEASVLDRLAGLCHQGFGETEIQLHHDGDTSASLRRKLEQAKADLTSHQLLARRREGGNVRFAFVHGNWALDNSRPDGRWCGVNDELTVLRDAGCYADFTMPSAPSETQTLKINSVYYATDDPEQPKSHNTGRDLTVGGRRRDGELLMVQGPLSLNWRRRKGGVLPRLENGALSAENPPTTERVDAWIRQGIAVRGREDWVFVKVYSHGAKPSNAETLLGPPLHEMFTHLETAYNDGANYRLHYVTAREMVNIIHAAESGRSGDPGSYRDTDLVLAT